MVKVWAILAQLLQLDFCGPQVQSFLDTFIFNQLTSCNLVRGLVGQVLQIGIFKSAFCSFANSKVKSQVEKLRRKNFVRCYQLFLCLHELSLRLLNGMFLHYKCIVIGGERRKDFAPLFFYTTSNTAMFHLFV